MTRFRKLIGEENPRTVFFSLSIFLLTAAWVGTSFLRIQSEQRKAPPLTLSVADSYDRFVSHIYKSSVAIGKLPVHTARPFIIRYKLIEFINSLQLSPEVHKRVSAHIQSEEFVSALIPLIWNLKEQYVLSENAAKDKNILSFQKFIEGNLSLQQSPGYKHSLFPVEQKVLSKASPKQSFLDTDKIKLLVELYDVVFLDPIAKASAFFSLHSAVEFDEHASLRALPIVKKIIQNTEFQNMLPTDDALHALSASLIFALREELNKSYRAFSQHVIRPQDLRKWLIGQMESPRQGRLWNYFDYWKNQRRFGVQITVDGLQGSLMKALVSPVSHSSFLKSILDESHSTRAFEPQVSYLKAAKPQTQFLQALVTNPQENNPFYLPFFKSLWLNSGKSIAQQGISSTPTISVRNLPIVMNGADVHGPGGTGIPNFHFVDRKKQRAFYFYGNDALLLEKLTLENSMRTPFERLNGLLSLNCFGQYDRGAKKTFHAFFNLLAGEHNRDIGEKLCVRELKDRLENEFQLKSLSEKILSFKNEMSLSPKGIEFELRLKKLESWVEEFSQLADLGLPQYLQIYNPWPDHFAHFKGPFSDEILSVSGELNRLDYWLQQVSKIYQIAELQERTLWAMAGDHGLAPVHYYVSPDELLFKNSPQKISYLKISSDEGEGPKLNNPLNPAVLKGHDAIIASTAGGSYVIDLFKDQQNHWHQAGTFDELKNWKLISGETIDWISHLRQNLKNTFDYFIVRDAPCDPTECRARIIGPQNQQALVAVKDNRYYYESKTDLLQQLKPKINLTIPAELNTWNNFVLKCLKQAKAKQPNTWCTSDEWLAVAAWHTRPDSVRQLARLYLQESAGSINLFPAEFVGFNTQVPGRHAGELFHEKDAFVAFWGSHLKAEKPLTNVLNGSIAPTLYHFLSGKNARAGQETWGFSSVLENLSPTLDRSLASDKNPMDR